MYPIRVIAWSDARRLAIKSGRNSFAGNIPDRQSQAAVRESDHVVVVAAHTLRRAARAGKIHSWNLRNALWKKPLLYLVSDFQFAIVACALGRLPRERLRQLVYFERQAGLCRDRLEHAQVGRRIRRFRSLGPKRHHTHQPVASGKRKQQFRFDLIQGRDFLGAGLTQPFFGTVPIHRRGPVCLNQVPNREGIFSQKHRRRDREADGLL